MDVSLSQELSFVCTSGELVWGQPHLMRLGYEGKEFDVSVPESYTSGTIICRDFNFKVKARKGKFITSKRHGLYVVRHVDTSLEEIMHKLQEADFYMSQVREDVLHVNRYDWNGHQTEDDCEDEMLEYQHGNAMLCESEKFPLLKEKLLQLKTLHMSASFIHEGRPFALSLRNDIADYEFGWLVFDKEELVAFAYDTCMGMWTEEI